MFKNFSDSYDGEDSLYLMPGGSEHAIKCLRRAKKALKEEIFKPVKNWSNIFELPKSGDVKCRVCLIGGPIIASMSDKEFKHFKERQADGEPVGCLMSNELEHGITAALITLNQPQDLTTPRKKSMILKIYDKAIELLKNGTAREICKSAGGF